MNQAFVFIKPHANTRAVQDLVSSTLISKGFVITSEGELTGEQIDADQLPVPASKFEAEFQISWQDALAKGIVYNAIDACAYLGLDSNGLDAAWGKCKKVKFGGGFYCGYIDFIPEKSPVYVFNGFFMSMRSKFVAPGTSIHYYVVVWDPSELPWSDFRGKVLGPTNPAEAPADSLRGLILAKWQELGLEAVPNTGDNGVHASASPFEGLAERMNWLKVPIEKDSFGARLVAAGVPPATIAEWSVDPQVKGKSLFDTLEDLDADECVAKAVELLV